ncbi:CGNR zinc finger domain-containing protein [Aestuariivirga litoralis]|uniref:CGNR zinc finger domain-containing protein n=1 Tax=Aestuariivirga litoralis TaxID=2650924 RepID=UPI0018C6E999|nr:CGNR zinc finger domain-containing protein [Aestuariivirga litoralis]
MEIVRAYQSPLGRMRMLAGTPALDFANTLHWRDGELLDFVPTYRALVEFCGPAHLLSDKEMRHVLRVAKDYPQRTAMLHADALAFRAVLKNWLAASAVNLPHRRVPQKTFAAAIDKLGDGVALGELLTLADETVTALRLPLLRIAAAACLLVLFSPQGDIRQCEADGCGGFFLNTSRSKPRRWCSMDGCGNRAKAARFRKARKSSS